MFWLWTIFMDCLLKLAPSWCLPRRWASDLQAWPKPQARRSRSLPAEAFFARLVGSYRSIDCYSCSDAYTKEFWCALGYFTSCWLILWLFNFSAIPPRPPRIYYCFCWLGDSRTLTVPIVIAGLRLNSEVPWLKPLPSLFACWCC